MSVCVLILLFIVLQDTPTYHIYYHYNNYSLD